MPRQMEADDLDIRALEDNVSTEGHFFNNTLIIATLVILSWTMNILEIIYC